MTAYTYIGDPTSEYTREFFHGVPGRDISAEEYAALAPAEQAAVAGNVLYVPVGADALLDSDGNMLTDERRGVLTAA